MSKRRRGRAVEGGSSVAFSIASRSGAYQGRVALRASDGAAVRITDEGVFEAQRALARERYGLELP